MVDTFNNIPNFIYGVLLTSVASLTIAIAYVLKKKAHNKCSKYQKAKNGGYGYLKCPLWWLGLFFMALGELFNLFALILIPAPLVASLGALSLLFSFLFASHFFNENLTKYSKIGIAVCVIGCILIIFFGPKESVQSMTEDEIKSSLLCVPFIAYFSTSVVLSIVLYLLSQNWGHKTPLIYVSICAMFGALLVVSTKLLGLMLRTTSFITAMSGVVIYPLLAMAIVCICLQLNFINKALDIFAVSMVTSLNYVEFTIAVTVASATIFSDFSKMGGVGIFGSILAFIVVIVGVNLMEFNR